MNMNDFVGKTINNIYCLKQEQIGLKGILYLEVDNVFYEIIAMGGCCSNSYFSHIDDTSVFNNSILLEFDTITNEKDIDEVQDTTIKYTFYKFKTTKGYATLEMRNLSNGYYNGYYDIEKCHWKPSDIIELGDF